MRAVVLCGVGFALSTVACAAAPGTGGSGGVSGFGGASGATGGFGGGSASGGTGGFAAIGGIGGVGGGGGPCTGIQCQIRECPSGTTTISGTIYDPAGKNPLYNVAVYVPNAPVEPLPQGASCDSCDSLYSGHPIAAALTDAAGRFVMQNVPDGSNIPLVVQVGKWRRQFVLPTVAPCQDNPQADRSLTLPKNRMEGDIPKIAISTGGADTLECLLRRIGVDASEYVGGPGGDPRIHIFQGGGSFMIPFLGNIGAPNTNPPAPTSPAALWTSGDELKNYDILLLSCEGAETASMNQQALHDYASIGGRVFASHFHYAWFNTGPYGAENLATWTTGGNSINDINGQIITTLSNGAPFPKGLALQEWLGNVNALTNGLLPIVDAKHNADVGPSHTFSQPWIVADQSASAPGATQYFSFNTPTDAQNVVDGPGPCGRVVFSDLHVGAASSDMPNVAVPGGCNNADLSAQEKALEFMLFDLSSCVTPDDSAPVPPPLE